jgi:hypothetical protein
MRPCTAGQNRFSLRISQITQLNQGSSNHYCIPARIHYGGRGRGELAVLFLRSLSSR